MELQNVCHLVSSCDAHPAGLMVLEGCLLVLTGLWLLIPATLASCWCAVLSASRALFVFDLSEQ